MNQIPKRLTLFAMEMCPLALSLAFVVEALQIVTPNQGYNYYITSSYPNDS